MNADEPAQPTMTRDRIFAVIALAGLGVIGLAGGLAIAELALRTVGPRESRYAVLPPGLRRESDPDPRLLPGIAGRARFTVNSLGLRGSELPEDSSVLRILVVGGSTTENVYLDDAETWTGLLERRLDPLPGGRRVWVGAAGRGGMNARDHVVQVRRLLEQLPRMDRVVVLAGVNDLTVALAQADTFRAPPPLSDSVAVLAQERRAFAIVPGRLHESAANAPGTPWYKRTAVWQLLRRLRARAAARDERASLQQDTRAENVQRWREARQRATRSRDALPALGPALAEYRRNLEAIATIGAARGVPVTFLTQPALWRADLDGVATRLLWFGGVGDFQRRPVDEYYTPAALAAALETFNRTLLEVCAAHRLDCLDLDARIPRTTEFFFDDVHFTERGATAVAEETAAWIRPVLVRANAGDVPVR